MKNKMNFVGVERAQIRLANLRDLKCLLELDEACFEHDRFDQEQFLYYLHEPTAMVIVAVNHDRIVGDLIGQIRSLLNYTEMELCSIAVSHSYRRNGLGSLLLKEFEDRAIMNSCRLCTLEVSEGNRSARALYERHGFKQVRIVKDYYGAGRDAITMHKSL